MARLFSPSHSLAVLRAGFGLYFLAQAYDKTSKQWLATGAPLERMLRQSLPRVAPWYGQFLQGTVLPHAAIFAQLVTLGEWAVGLSLLLGLLTPLGALVGIWLNANYMLDKGLLNTAGSVDRLFILGELVILIASAGLVWGLDGVLRQRLFAKSRRRGELRPATSPSRLQRRAQGRG